MNCDIENLLQEQKMRKKFLLEKYEAEYQRCINYISYIMKYYNDEAVVYTISSVDSYLPEYIKYIKNKLRESKFFVKTMQPGHMLYVSWSKMFHEETLSTEKEPMRNLNIDKNAKIEEINPLSGVEPTSGLNLTNEGPRGWASPILRVKDNEIKEIEPEDSIEYIPTSGLSNVHLRSTLMLSNPKYSHLKNYKKLKKKREKRD